jgi:UDP-3-O-[3-hydroxymyristoyl] glucosamine N-acyltransferase
MARLRSIQPLSLSVVHRFLGGELIGPPDGVITGLSNLENAGSGDLAYLASDRFLTAACASGAGALITFRPLPEIATPQLIVDNPAYAFACVAQQFFVPPYRSRGIAADLARGEHVSIGPDVSIWPRVTLGDRVVIGARVTLFPGVFIGDDSAVGDDSTLHSNVVVRERCTIGARVIIHSGTAIGSDGFGYVQHGGRHHKIPQLGGVTIEDDVELGANVTIDRATLGQTIVKQGAKIDNLVQIAHNVTVGEHNILVAQVGIAGSTTLGNYVMVGGQAGLADHLTIGDHVMIAAKSGVTRSLEGNQIVSGAPAMPHAAFLKAQAVVPQLPELRRRVGELDARMQVIEKKSKRNKPRPKQRR